MNLLRSLIVTMARLSLCLPALVFASGLEGKLAPPFQAHMSDGPQVDNANMKGKVVLLHFWATWCENCEKELPALDTYYRQHKQDGLEVVAINLDDKKDDALVQQVANHFTFPFALDRDSTHDAYGRVWIMPMTFVIDKQGILRKDGSAHPWIMDAKSLEQIVTPLLQAP